jgi:asparagine synthase (glutamine-hydrolysing)
MTGRGSGRVQLQGWIEENGRLLTLAEIEGILSQDPEDVAGFAGEFHLSWDGCTATDRLGLLGIPGPAGSRDRPGGIGAPLDGIPGPAGRPPSEGGGAVPGGWGPSGPSRDRPGGRRREAAPPVQGGKGPLWTGKGAPLEGIPGLFGVITCQGEVIGEVDPEVPFLDLEEAVRTAVSLRAVEGAVTALSGGVDSALIARFAGLPCVTIGMAGSPDPERGRAAAHALGLPWEGVIITEEEVEAALPRVIGAIPGVTPLDVSIATGLFFVARWAGEKGYRRVLVGQGADELFGGYARYRTAGDIPAMLARDFASLRGQALRDQAVARLHGTAFSCPYLDLRVVRAAQAIPPGRLIGEGTGKLPLRELAARLLPPEIAHAPKKAMQYGTGIAGAIRDLARKNGYKRSVQRYLFQLTGDRDDLA